MEPCINNPEFLRDQQYRDASNLNARLAIHQSFSTNNQGWAPFVWDAISALPADADVLECGCGPASLWTIGADRIPPGWRITLTDFSEGMVEEAKRAIAMLPEEVGAQFSVRQANIEELPFADGAFDGVIANHMLYHVPDRAKAIGEVRRVLRAGGLFFAATNGEGHMAEQRQLGDRFVQGHGIASADWHGTVGRTFSLENGAAQLAPFFDSVEMRYYDDALLVTEVEPLLRYFYSMGMIPADLEADLRAFLQQEMDANGGVVEIGKSTGIFIAQ